MHVMLFSNTISTHTDSVNDGMINEYGEVGYLFRTLISFH
jgi:hypothetical protein